MSKPPIMRVPEWVTPENYQRFALRLAALYYNENGRVHDLSLGIGLSQSALHMALSYKGLNADHCIKLEKLLGRDLFPREFFAPNIFIAQE
jgi:hypothetical protein